jgi:WD40 repeat protein
VLVGTVEGFVLTFDGKGEESVAPFAAASDVLALSVSPAGDLVAVSGADTTARLRVIDVAGVGLLPGIPEKTTGLEFAEDGSLIVDGQAGVASWTIDVPRGRPWSASRKEVADAATDAIGPTAQGAVSVLQGPQRQIVIGGEAGITIRDVPGNRVVKHLPASDFGGRSIASLAVNRSWTRFAVGMEESVRIFSLDGAEVVRVDYPLAVVIRALAFHPDGDLFTGSNHGEVQRIGPDGRRRQAIRVFSGGTIGAFAIPASGDTVFIGGSLGIRAYDTATQSLLAMRMPGWLQAVDAVAISPDGRLLAAARSFDGTGDVALWRVGWQEWLAEACERLRGHELFTTLAKPGGAAETVSGAQPQRAFDACSRRVWNVK